MDKIIIEYPCNVGLLAKVLKAVAQHCQEQKKNADFKPENGKIVIVVGNDEPKTAKSVFGDED